METLSIEQLVDLANTFPRGSYIGDLANEALTGPVEWVDEWFHLEMAYEGLLAGRMHK